MLKIRLQRIGRKNDPAYRVIVAEHTRGPKSGNFVERVGTYNPKTKDRALEKERIEYWLSVGAKPSGTVHNMLVSDGILTGEKVNVLPKKTPIVKEEAPAEESAPAAEGEADAQDEAPAEDAGEGEEAASEDTSEAAEEPEAPAEDTTTEEPAEEESESK